MRDLAFTSAVGPWDVRTGYDLSMRDRARENEKGSERAASGGGRRERGRSGIELMSAGESRAK